MKATIEKGNAPKEKEIEYPCLMKSYESGMIVMMTSPRNGIVLMPEENPNYKCGEGSSSLAMFLFHPLPSDHKVILQND